MKYTELEAKHIEPVMKYMELRMKYMEPEREYMEVVKMLKREREREKKMKKYQAAIVACILFKTVCVIATWKKLKKRTLLEIIATPQKKLQRFGCQIPEQVNEFAVVVRFYLLPVKLYLTYLRAY